MKTILGALAALIILVGCQPPVSVVEEVPEEVTKVVKNSLWKTVTPSFSRSTGRDLTGDDLVAYVEEYNATTFDDYLRIYDSDEVPPLEDAPPVSVFIVNPETYEVNVSYENVPRALLVENAVGWRAEAYGQLIFIDHVPPPPVIEPPLDPYAYWAIYAIDNDTGAILYEDHCGYRGDRQFYQEDIGDYASPEAYYPQRLAAFNSIAVVTANNCRVITRQLYTPPVTP